MRPLAPIAALALTLAAPRAAQAFCGFYVSGADTKLVNRATHVALMRAGTRTVLSMQNNYEGPPQDFAMVVPVPVVLQKDQVKTLPHDVLDRVDQMGAPRLVEYWESDPCGEEVPSGLGGIGVIGRGPAGGHGPAGGAPAVKVEAQFAVGEYDIVILSATDSTALDRWLRDNKYKIPEGAEPYLRPYVQSGMKFFVAKVDIEKVEMKDGRAALSPLRFHYDSETFSLPIRLGLINAGDAQDLVVSVLSDRRYEVANYPNVVIPTNLDVSESARESFGAFYAALFDETLRQKPGAVVTEYSWDAGSCDPCPGPALTMGDLATLGGDALPDEHKPSGLSGNMNMGTVRMGNPEVTGNLPPEIVRRILRQNFGRFRLCYENALRQKPGLSGRVTVGFTIGKDGTVSGNKVVSDDLPDKGAVDCVSRAFQGMSFPQPEGGTVSVVQGINFAPGASGARPMGVVLTRLHMRYTKEALGEDLVFRAAEPIVGGREIRSASGALEQGAVLAGINNFQARYVIRHPWTGAVDCPSPVRGRWGGPPSGQTPAPKAARDVAFAPRTGDLRTFLVTGVPTVSGPRPDVPEAPPAPPAPPPSSAAAPAASSAAPPAASAEPKAGGGCGCAAASERPSAGWLSAAMLAGMALLTRRGRRRSPPR